MLNELISWVLNTYLGKYLEDFNPQQLSVALLSGAFTKTLVSTFYENCVAEIFLWVENVHKCETFNIKITKLNFFRNCTTS